MFFKYIFLLNFGLGAVEQGYSHNTYHGQVRHYRTPLTLDPKPVRFTDNPLLYGPSLAAGAASLQRRRSSNASNDSEVVTRPNLSLTAESRFFYSIWPS